MPEVVTRCVTTHWVIDSGLKLVVPTRTWTILAVVLEIDAVSEAPAVPLSPVFASSAAGGGSGRGIGPGGAVGTKLLLHCFINQRGENH